MAIGKLNGVISPATPIGLRTTSTFSPGRGEAKTSPLSRSASLA